MSKKLRKYLQYNKIYFETIMTALLSIMAITVAWTQTSTTMKQTRLMEIQTKIAERQLERQEIEKKIERTAQYGELNNAIASVMSQFSSENGSDDLFLLTQEQQILLFERIERILSSQVHNGILNENKDCLVHWSDALGCAKDGASFKYYNPFDKKETLETFKTLLNSIHRDVLYIRGELIFNSKEFPFPYVEREEEDKKIRNAQAR